MKSDCHNREAFLDGQLDPEQAERFRMHLPDCAECQAELYDLVQLATLAEQARPAGPLLKIAGSSRRSRVRMVVVGVAAIAAAAAVVLLFKSGKLLFKSGKEDPVLIEVVSSTAGRPLEARLTRAEADHFRPYDTSLSAPIAPRLPLRALAELEARGDVVGVSTALALVGEYQRAADLLDRVPPTPDIDSDRAAIAFARGRLEEALILDNAALAKSPRHAQAWWNRGLILRGLGLDVLAAESFERVAEMHEPGWSAEAARLAAALKEGIAHRRDGWAAIKQKGIALVQTGEPIPDDEVAARPGIARLYFYHAAHAAPSRERVLALLPMARRLDRASGDETLQRYLERISREDFRLRTPLARTYLDLFNGSHYDDAAISTYLDRLRRSHQDDLLLGALTLTDRLPRQLVEYRRLASASGDPWFIYTAEYEQAKAEIARGDMLEAERRLLDAAPRCHATRLEYRCAYIEHLLTTLYLTLNRFSEARQHADSGWSQSRQSGEWGNETIFLQDLATASEVHRSLDLDRSYLEETLRREIDNCEVQRYIHLQLARLALDELRPDQARARLAAAPRCKQPLSLTGIEELAVLAHWSGTPEEATRAQEALVAQRASETLRPGERAIADALEGRLTIERDRTRGRALLGKAIAEADAQPAWDAEATEARWHAFGALIADAGRNGAWEDTLALFAREARVEGTNGCALGVAADYDRLVIALRMNGKASGIFRVLDNPSIDVARLVPEEVKAALKGCDTVDVFARPPFAGHADLLPRDVAWRHRVGRPPTGDSMVSADRRLLVSGVDPPPALGLPHLPEWKHPEPSDSFVVLSGAAATPERVLAEMENATEIDFHVHGLVDLGVADASLLVLSPGADGRYALTAKQVRSARLRGRPLVVLAACHAAEGMPNRLQPWSLPVAFIAAGARAVFASPATLSDGEAEPFFASLRAAILAGKPAAAALRDARVQAGASSSVQNVLLFE